MLTAVRRPRGDDGFTLVEVIVTVAIMGVIVTGLTGVVISYLTTTTDTQSRLTESQDLQFATSYWQRDVASIGVRSTVYDASDDVHSYPLQRSVDVAPCPGAGDPVVTLAWSEYTSLDSQAAPTTVRVTYLTRPAGDRLELVRRRCGSTPSEFVVADNLSEAPTVACTGGGVSGCGDASGKVPGRITMTLRVLAADGHGGAPFTATIEGERRQT